MSTVLFQDGDWRICRTGVAGKRNNSAIYHRCGDDHDLVQQWWHISHASRCLYCATKVPDPIMGLWLLHTWDQP